MPAVVTSCRLPSSGGSGLRRTAAGSTSSRLAFFLLGFATRGGRTRSRSSSTGGRRRTSSRGSSLGRRRFDFLGARMMDRHDRLIAAMREIDQLTPAGSGMSDRRLMSLISIVRQVDLEELRQILRQAHDLHRFSRCETTPPCVFTPGAPAAPLKCSGISMRICSFSSTRCRSMCRIWFFAGWRCTSLTIAACVSPLILAAGSSRRSAR